MELRLRNYIYGKKIFIFDYESRLEFLFFEVVEFVGRVLASRELYRVGGISSLYGYLL